MGIEVEVFPADWDFFWFGILFVSLSGFSSDNASFALSLSLSSILYRNIFTGLRIHHPSPSSIRFSFLIKSSIRFSVTLNVPLLYYWVLIGLHSIHLLTSIKSLSLSFHLYHSLLVFFFLSSLSFFFLLFFIPLDHGGTQANKPIH